MNWLNERNYLKWSQFDKKYLKGKERLDNLLGIGPKREKSMFEAWNEVECLIMS